METFVIVLIISLIVGTFSFNLWLSVLNYRNRTAPIPEIVSGIYEDKEYDKWLRYSMEKYRFGLFTSFFDVVLIIVLLFTGAFLLFEELSLEITSNIDLQILVFFGFYYYLIYFFDVFFSYYIHFSIEQRYGFNKLSKKMFVIDKIKTLVLVSIFGGGIILLLSTLFNTVGNFFFISSWASIIVIMLVVNMFFVKLILPVFNKLTPLEEGELKDKIHEFANKVGYEVSNINVMDASKRSTRLNAFFSGMGKTKQIVLFDTLIKKLSPDQIVAVLAHEIGHSKHKHMINRLILSSVMISINLGAFIFTLKSPLLSTAFGFEDAHFGFGIIIFSILLAPISIIIEAVTSGLSRKNEFQADKYAVDNGYKEHLCSAFRIFAKENYTNLTPHPFYVKLTYSHPPLVDRLEAIERIEE